MNVRDFYYDLPPERIAQEPVEPRDHSRLMILDKPDGIKHEYFYDLPSYLSPGDVLVFNDTRVIPARLYGRKEEGGGEVEILLLTETAPDRWKALVKPGKRIKPGQKIIFAQGKLEATVIDYTGFGGRILEFASEMPVREVIFRYGEMPLPPYIHTKLHDRERYQTVYSRVEGSAAAPTAGLHFTPALMEKIRAKGVQEVFVTLHVGLDTFRPVQTERVEEHRMHSEFCSISADSARIINAAYKNGGKIVAVGTTVVRTLESFSDEEGELISGSKWTDIFIYPGYKFKMVQRLITNFHLPCSSLLMLVSAFAGKERIMKAYREAIEKHYRFFSFGDAMMILE